MNMIAWSSLHDDDDDNDDGDDDDDDDEDDHHCMTKALKIEIIDKMKTINLIFYHFLSYVLSLYIMGNRKIGNYPLYYA